MAIIVSCLERIARKTNEEQNRAPEIVEEFIPNRDIKLITFIIFSSVLLVFLGLVAKLVVIKRTLLSLNVKPNVFKLITSSKESIAQEEVIIGIMKSLFEVKRSNSIVKLLIKHVILATTIRFASNSSFKEKTKCLGCSSSKHILNHSMVGQKHG